VSRFRILSIDGGGIKGVFPAAFLAEIEGALGLRSAAEYFDLIAGTSVGGILALGLGLGLSAQDLVKFLTELGPSVFPPSSRPSVRLLLGLVRYDPEPLREGLSRVFGTRTLAESHSRLLIPSFDAKKADIHIYKTAHCARLMMDYRVEALEVAMSTAAAPTYFPAYDSTNRITLVDGAVWANNPVALAVVEAITLLGQKPEDIDVLSVGTTEEVLDFQPKWHSGLFWLTRGIFAAMRGQSRSALGMAQHLTGRDKGADKILRVDPPVSSGRYRIDGVKQIEELRGLGYSEARHRLPYVRDRFFDKQCEPFVSLHK
jgi:patatin-like phospholipase/acyl hydrolase